MRDSAIGRSKALRTTIDDGDFAAFRTSRAVNWIFNEGEGLEAFLKVQGRTESTAPTIFGLLLCSFTSSLPSWSTNALVRMMIMTIRTIAPRRRNGATAVCTPFVRRRRMVHGQNRWPFEGSIWRPDLFDFLITKESNINKFAISPWSSFARMAMAAARIFRYWCRSCKRPTNDWRTRPTGLCINPLGPPSVANHT